MNLAPQEISRDVLREKYCQGEESTINGDDASQLLRAPSQRVLDQVVFS
jgi:hypothetical protein